MSVDSSFDMNIDENFLMGHDDILFADEKTDQFDLASYITGEASSLLLSPLFAAKPRPVTENQLDSQLAAFNRRKRRNLTKSFIYTSSDESDAEDKKPAAVQKAAAKDSDPVWNPTPSQAKPKGELIKKKNVKVKVRNRLSADALCV